MSSLLMQKYLYVLPPTYELTPSREEYKDTLKTYVVIPDLFCCAFLGEWKSSFFLFSFLFFHTMISPIPRIFWSNLFNFKFLIHSRSPTYNQIGRPFWHIRRLACTRSGRQTSWGRPYLRVGGERWTARLNKKSTRRMRRWRRVSWPSPSSTRKVPSSSSFLECIFPV